MAYGKKLKRSSHKKGNRRKGGYGRRKSSKKRLGSTYTMQRGGGRF